MKTVLIGVLALIFTLPLPADFRLPPPRHVDGEPQLDGPSPVALSDIDGLWPCEGECEGQYKFGSFFLVESDALTLVSPFSDDGRIYLRFRWGLERPDSGDPDADWSEPSAIYFDRVYWADGNGTEIDGPEDPEGFYPLLLATGDVPEVTAHLPARPDRADYSQCRQCRVRFENFTSRNQTITSGSRVIHRASQYVRFVVEAEETGAVWSVILRRVEQRAEDAQSQ